jgi:DNA-3-methyladenine glycosylase II
MASCEQGLREITDNSSTCFFIRTEAPFDFERSANIHSHFQKSLPDVYENGLHKRVLHVCGKPVLVIVSSKGTTARPRLRVEAHPHLSIAEAKSLRNLLRTMFASSFDFHSFRKVAKRDRLMNTVSKEVAGLRPIAPPSIFEALVIAITEQQISLDAAIAIRSRLIEKYGEVVRFDGRRFYAFPTAMSLTTAKLKQMRAVGLSRSKALYISELARRVEDGELDLEGLRNRDDETVVAELTKIRGVGPWTAEYVLIRGMGRANSLPADDLGIQHAVSQAYFKGKRISSKEVRRILSKFAPYSGIAAFYLMYYLFWLPRRAK